MDLDNYDWEKRISDWDDMNEVEKIFSKVTYILDKTDDLDSIRYVIALLQRYIEMSS